jgi:PAP2 superfamily
MNGIGRAGKRVGLVLVGLATMVSAYAVPAAERANASSVDTAAVVIQWNANAQTAIVATAAQGPTVAYLHFAMVQGAVYDAVNGIVGGYQPYLGAPSSADPGDSPSAAAAQAAHDVLLGLFPAQQATLDGQLAVSLAQIADGTAKTGGIEVGAAAASAMLANRANDGRFSQFTVIQGTEPGEWRSTAFVNGVPVVEPTPWVANVRPFVIPSAAALRSDGPNPLKSDAYARDLNEVKRLGAANSTIRTPDQTEAAIFWQANGAALMNAVMRQLAGTQHLDIADAARMFAEGNMAGADGAIACWTDKYYWHSWRPITAIRLADTDGNPDTVADPNWTPLFSLAPPLTTPAFPEHPSGHTSISGAVVETLKDFFGTDKLAFDLFSPLSGTTRSFDRLSVAMREIIDARVWAGIHFRTADTQGHVMGRKVAHILARDHFQPVT